MADSKQYQVRIEELEYKIHKLEKELKDVQRERATLAEKLNQIDISVNEYHRAIQSILETPDVSSITVTSEGVYRNGVKIPDTKLNRDQKKSKMVLSTWQEQIEKDINLINQIYPDDSNPKLKWLHSLALESILNWIREPVDPEKYCHRCAELSIHSCFPRRLIRTSLDEIKQDVYLGVVTKEAEEILKHFGKESNTLFQNNLRGYVVISGCTETVSQLMSSAGQTYMEFLEDDVMMLVMNLNHIIGNMRQAEKHIIYN